MPRVKLDRLKLYPDNPRQGDVGLISQSLEELGQYRTIVVNKRTMEILAGNHTFKAAQALGWTSIDVQFIDVDDETARRIVLMDNRASDQATYDEELLAELLVELATDTDRGLAGTGYDGDDLDDLLAQLTREQPYTRTVESPIYEPSGEPPAVKDLYDGSRANELMDELRKHKDLPEEVIDFLRLAAFRHVTFRFDWIADYYAHAPAEVQRLMEDSALVIVDFDRAIELGFVQLTDDVLSMFEEDHPDA